MAWDHCLFVLGAADLSRGKLSGQGLGAQRGTSWLEGVVGCAQLLVLLKRLFAV